MQETTDPGIRVSTDPRESLWQALPDWAKVGLTILAITSGGGGALYAFLPFETKESAKAAHDKLEANDEALQVQINELQKTMPKAVADQVVNDIRAELRRRR